MLKHKGITVVSMEGVQRTGESAKMRNSVEKIRVSACCPCAAH